MKPSNPSTEDLLNTLSKLQYVDAAPQVLNRALALLRDPNSELNDLVRVIRTDASITADVIRLSNTAYYGSQVKLNSLDEAIARIGFAEVTRLVGLCISRGYLAVDLKLIGIPMKEFWSFNVAVAALMEMIARALKLNAAEAYTLGILHRIGMLAFDKVLVGVPNVSPWDRSACDLEEWEMKTIGMHHGYAGAMLLRRWEFSESICETIESQSESIEEAEPKTMIAVMRCVLSLIKLTEPEFDQLPDKTEIVPEISTALGLSADKILTLLKKGQDGFARMKASFAP